MPKASTLIPSGCHSCLVVVDHIGVPEHRETPGERVAELDRRADVHAGSPEGGHVGDDEVDSVHARDAPAEDAMAAIDRCEIA